MYKTQYPNNRSKRREKMRERRFDDMYRMSESSLHLVHLWGSRVTGSDFTCWKDWALKLFSYATKIHWGPPWAGYCLGTWKPVLRAWTADDKLQPSPESNQLANHLTHCQFIISAFSASKGKWDVLHSCTPIVFRQSDTILEVSYTSDDAWQITKIQVSKVYG